MNELDIITAKKINTLHEGIMSLLHQGIEKAVEIGELLTGKKAELQHGEFGIWIKDNLIFTDRTAQRYMKLFENKDKVLQTGNISEAYKMLGEGKNDNVSDLNNKKSLTIDTVIKQITGLINFPSVADKLEFKANALIFKEDITLDEWQLVGSALGLLMRMTNNV
ncbi:MAG: DUF3102 domain-containing protein [Bacteroidales bacterium]|nr:DUF3102 domain-containing protein [Bacteroidales bacterium]